MNAVDGTCCVQYLCVRDIVGFVCVRASILVWCGVACQSGM